MMKQAFRQFQPALHSAGKSLRFLVGAIRQPDPRQHLCNPRFQGRAAQSVKMTLMPQIFGGGQFHINALCLEHDPDLDGAICWALSLHQIP